jgi:acetyltransferase-like isoleucine patch superfamily enzyme
MKSLQGIGRIAGMVLAVPCALRYLVLRMLLGDDAALSSCSEAIARRPGKLGVYSRQWFYKGVLASVGRDVHFGFLSLFSKTKAEIGSRVYIGRMCTIGWARIGDDVMLADGVQVLSGRRQHSDPPGIPVPPSASSGQAAPGVPGTVRREAPQVFTQVTIGTGAWLGAGAIIMADVGEHAVVGAGAVVVQPVAAGAKVGGVPARSLTR